MNSSSSEDEDTEEEEEDQQPSTSSMRSQSQCFLEKEERSIDSHVVIESTSISLQFYQIDNLKSLLKEYDSDKINIIEIANCLSTQKAINAIAKDNFRFSLKKLKNLHVLKLKINEKLEADKIKFIDFGIKGNFLIAYESTVETFKAQKIVFWKNSESLFEFKLIRYSVDLSDFILQFLIENVNVKYTAAPSWSGDLKIAHLFDSNSFNLLMRAINDNRNLNFINELLHLPFDIDRKSFKNNQNYFDEVTAADIAWRMQNFEVLFKLLKTNSTYPKEFGQTVASDEIKQFLEISNNLHDAIRRDEIERVTNIVNNNPDMRHFYDSSNKSAAAIAIAKEKIIIYQFLAENYRNIGPHENVADIMKYVTEETRKEIGEINSKYSIDYSKKYLAIHHASVVTSPDNASFRLNEQAKIEALNALDNIDLTQQLLEVTSIHKNLKINFDLNRDSVQFMHPYQTDSGSEGLFKYNGYIYVGAKKLKEVANKSFEAKEADKFAVAGCLAHELCHFAMNLTFQNKSKPYAIDDKVNEARFNEIIKKYKVLIDEHKLKVEKCKEIVAKFKRLISFCNDKSIKDFEYYERWTANEIKELQKKVDDCNEKIANIRINIKKSEEEGVKKKKRKVENVKENDDNEKEIKEITEEIWKHENFLSEHHEIIKICQNNLEKGTFVETYQNEIEKIEREIKTHEDSIYYEQIVRLVYNYEEYLWPAELIVRVPQIIVHYHKDKTGRLNTLQDTFLDLFKYYNDVVVPKINETLPKLKKLFNYSDEIKYNELTEAHKGKIHHSIVNFQGKETKFNEIADSEIYQLLTSKQIRKIIINDWKMIIGYEQKVNTEFYIDRKFADHDLEYEESDEEFTNVSNKMKNFDEISSITDDKKIILLSDHAGAGKTTTFKHLTVKLKVKYSNYWISYIDLKQHLKVYEKFERNFNQNQILNILLEILNLKNEFEVKIFTKLFKSQRVILLFDGVDEISPIFKNFFIKLIKGLKKTKNQQYIATRPQHAEELAKKFKQNAYKLMPYNESMKIEFIKKVFESFNKNNDDAHKILKAIDEQISPDVKINSPLMLQMITELYINDERILEDFNYYLLYDKMLEMKKDIAEERGKIVNKDRDNHKSYLSIWQIHQIYALKFNVTDLDQQLYQIDINKFSILERWKKEKSKWTPEAISRYGFLIVDNWNESDEFPDFVHRTFAEFFIAKFVIEDLYERADEMSEMDIKIRIELIDFIVYNDDQNMWDFISCFIDNHKCKKLNIKVLNMFTSERVREMINKYLKLDHIDTVKLIKFFSIDERFLVKFKIDSGETIFQKFILRSDMANHSSLNDNFDILEIYEKSLGENWFNHIGYDLKENFSMLNDEQIESIINVDFVRKSNDESDERYKYSKLNCKKYFKLLHFIEQVEIPQNDLLQFFNFNHKQIFENSLSSSLLIEKLMKIIQNSFSRQEFYEFWVANMSRSFNNDNSILLSDEYEKNTKSFCEKLETFLKSSDKIMPDCFELFRVELCFKLCGLESLIKRVNDFTKIDMQKFLIKYSIIIISYIKYSIELLKKFEDLIKNTFENSKSELKKFLENRYEGQFEDLLRPYNGHTVLSYVESNKGFWDEFRPMGNFLKNLAQEIEMTDDEIENLSKRLENK